MFSSCSELGIFMYNLSSYCGLVDAKIRASDKDLSVSDADSFTCACYYIRPNFRVVVNSYKFSESLFKYISVPTLFCCKLPQG